MTLDDDAAEELELFVEAQEGVWDDVTRELAQGRKHGHWMWFVFPQLDGLGSSPTAVLFALDGVEEAASYLAHPVLGPRLRETVDLVLQHRKQDASAIFGPLDALKFRSSMTLFALADPDEPRFSDALDAFFGGASDPRTLQLLGRS